MKPVEEPFLVSRTSIENADPHQREAQMNETKNPANQASAAYTIDTFVTSTSGRVVSRRQFLQAGATVTFGVTAFMHKSALVLN